MDDGQDLVFPRYVRMTAPTPTLPEKWNLSYVGANSAENKKKNNLQKKCCQVVFLKIKWGEKLAFFNILI